MGLEKISFFVRSMKWRFYFTTIQIFIGYLLVVWPHFSLGDLYKMAYLFIIFGPLLHGGIYTLNDIFNLKEDKKHPIKKNRPLALGQITKKEAYVFSISLITAALVFSYYINFTLVIICFLFLIINLIYTLMLKKILYLEIIANSLTHPLRFYTGVIAAGSSNFNGFQGIALLIGLFALGIAALKRKKELAEAKASSIPLKYYTNSSLRNFIVLTGAIIMIKTLISKNLDFYFGIITLMLYLIVMLGYHKSNFIQKLMNKWY